MTASKSSRCRGCNAEMIWTVTEGGRTMPVDKEPHPEGTIRLREHNGTYFSKVLKADEARTHQGPLYRSHFATCENANRFRRPK